MEKVDVLINVFSKPWQTALSLLSLLRHSGQHIDKIYFHEEPATSSFEKQSQHALLTYLGDRIIHFTPTYWLAVEATDAPRLAEEAYRLSMRYQYGFEKSDKRHVLLVHNDIIVHDDVVGYLRDAIKGYSGVGQVGQCWWCPAHQQGLCTPDNYTAFTPDFARLNALYNEGFDPQSRRAYHYGWKAQFVARPWPLPECRLNEWGALIDRHKTVPDTMPLGTAVPLGAQIPSGAQIGERFDEPVNLDTGVQWFRDLSHMGHVFKHVDIYQHITHQRRGHSALLNAELYITQEMHAKNTLRAEFPDFFAIATA